MNTTAQPEALNAGIEYGRHLLARSLLKRALSYVEAAAEGDPASMAACLSAEISAHLANSAEPSKLCYRMPDDYKGLKIELVEVPDPPKNTSSNDQTLTVGARLYTGEALDAVERIYSGLTATPEVFGQISALLERIDQAELLGWQMGDDLRSQVEQLLDLASRAPLEHYRRVTELLVANERVVLERREARQEARREQIATTGLMDEFDTLGVQLQRLRRIEALIIVFLVSRYELDRARAAGDEAEIIRLAACEAAAVLKLQRAIPIGGDDDA